MAEVLGIATSVLALLEVSIAGFERIQKARRWKKDLGRTLERHCQELKATKNVIQAVTNEEALHILSVQEALLILQAVVNRLSEHLEKLGQMHTKGFLKQFPSQLIRGWNNDDDDLGDVMKDLSRAKENLGMKIQVVHVGISQTMHRSVITTAAAVERHNSLLERSALSPIDTHSPFKDDDETLCPPKYDEKYPPASNSESPHRTPSPSLSPSPSPIDESVQSQSRMVAQNSSEGHAIQVNGPIGERGWRDVDRVGIVANKAGGMSIQLNYATSTDVFEQLLAARRMDIRSV